MKRLILFLIRRKLGLKKYEKFQFVNQKSSATYCFTETGLFKLHQDYATLSGVGINWLLDDDCEIVKV